MKHAQKLKVLARKSALAYKAKEKGIAILEDFNFEAPKTKEYIKMLEALSLNDKKTLLVLAESNKNVELSGSNIKKAKVVTAEQLNTYDVVNADNLVLVESSIEKIDNLLNK